MSWTFWVPLLGILPMLVIILLITWQDRRLNADERREAITTELRNLPAASLQKQRDALVQEQITRLVVAMVIGLSAGGVFLARRAPAVIPMWDWLDFLVLLFLVGSGLYYGRQVIRAMPLSRRLRQAIRAEQATAQEIAAALAGDCRIIHDVQASNFNIDHVVITPAGVFAVETKSRRKPPAGSGGDAVRVRYDGKQLHFPGWSEEEPLIQAARQAKWLAQYLLENTGTAYPVTPILALPGWYVEFTGRPDSKGVYVVNPKNVRSRFLPEQPARLNSQGIQAAAKQIERLAKTDET